MQSKIALIVTIRDMILPNSSMNASEIQEIIIVISVLAVGIIPLLFQLKVIGFNLPVSLNIAIPWVYLVSGVFLIIGGFMGM